MAQIRSSSAELVAFFETGDVPTADNFTDFIYSTAIYDGTLPQISGSGVSTASFAQLLVLGNAASHLIPNYTNTYKLGSTTSNWQYIYVNSASITTLHNYTGSNAEDSIINLSSSLVPSTNNAFNLGSLTKEYKNVYIGGVLSTDTIADISASNQKVFLSSSLVPSHDNIWDLGASGNEFKDLYIDGIAYIDTIDNTSAVTIVTASINLVSSSLIPDADDSWDLGASGREWKDLYVDGTAHIDTLSVSALANNININGISSSNQEINLSGSFIPKTDDTYNLGSTTNEWKDLHIDGVAHIDTLGSATGASGVEAYINTATINTIAASGSYTGTVKISGSLIPGNDDSVDLGSSALQWKDLYVDGVANIDTIGGSADGVTNAYITTATIDNINASGSLGGNITMSGSLVPGNDNLHDLGSETKEFKNAYIDGILSVDVIADISASNQKIFVSSSLCSLNDGIWDLGSSTNEWGDLYVDGTGYIDTLISDTGSVGRIASSLIPSVNNTYDLGSSDFRYNEVYVISQSLTTSASLSAVRFENLPTTEAQARLIGSGALWVSSSVDGGATNSSRLYVFTG